MSGGLVQAAFRIGFFIVFVSGGLLFFLKPGSAEQAISLFTLLIGLLFLAGVVIVVRLGQRKP